eukprot:COSAG02_NODE_11_length_58539_cov_103.119473_16_plen_89_part_00
MAELISVVKQSVSGLHHGIDGKDVASVEQAAPSKRLVRRRETQGRGAILGVMVPDAQKVCPAEAKADTGLKFALASRRDAPRVFFPHG